LQLSFACLRSGLSKQALIGKVYVIGARCAASGAAIGKGAALGWRNCGIAAPTPATLRVGRPWTLPSAGDWGQTACIPLPDSPVWAY